MNKKVICLFAIFSIAVLTVGGVSAANLVNHDFGDNFSMKIPKNADFHKEKNSTEINGVKMEMIAYYSDSLAIMYIDSQVISENSSYGLYQGVFQNVNPDLTQCYESQDDNLRILEPTVKDKTHISVVGTSSGNKIIILAGNDLDTLKAMGRSIRFS
jgi:hypothetical protein